MRYNGMTVLVSPYLAEFNFVRRAWRERLFTRPWRPWVTLRRAEQPPRYVVDPHKNIIWTTERGRIALREATQTGGANGG